MRQCHTSGMTNSPPVNPKPQNPKFGAVWFDDADGMLAWDGSAWVPYEDLPAWPGGGDPDPSGVIRDV
jgi:hypothetical protein